MNEVIILVVIGLYMAMMIGIGVYFGNKNKTSEDYFLGGRNLGPWVTAMSAEASDMSSWLLMGLPGLAYLSGFCDAGWTAIGLIIGTYLNWKIVAKRLRTYSYVCRNSFTLPDFFSNRFRDEKKILMAVSSILMVVFFTVYTASGFSACGKLFNSLFGYDYMTAMIVCSIVIILYTSIGGFLAASTTDFIQGLLMSVSIVVVLVVGVMEAGGIEAVLENGKNLAGYFSLTKVHDAETGKALSYGLITVVSGLAWGLGYFGMPHILVRFMAIKSAKEIKKSRLIAMIWCVISLIIAVCIGFTGAKLFPGVLKGGAEETIFIVMAKDLLPVVVVGLIISGILAATMSTADSQMLLVSSSIAQNLYKGIFKKNASEKQVLWVSRATTIIVAIIGMIIASDQNSKIFELVSYAWSGFGAAFGPLIIFALFWKRTTLAGALSGMLTGGILSIVWSLYISKLGGVFAVYSLLPAFVASCVVIVVVSLLTKKPSDEIVSEFDSVKNYVEK